MPEDFRLLSAACPLGKHVRVSPCLRGRGRSGSHCPHVCCLPRRSSSRSSSFLEGEQGGGL